MGDSPCLRSLGAGDGIVLRARTPQPCRQEQVSEVQLVSNLNPQSKLDKRREGAGGRTDEALGEVANNDTELRSHPHTPTRTATNALQTFALDSFKGTSIAEVSTGRRGGRGGRGAGRLRTQGPRRRTTASPAPLRTLPPPLSLSSNDLVAERF